MLNKVMLIGHLGRAPEMRSFQNGSQICNFSIATDDSYIDHDGNKVERAQWHSIVTYQKLADTCSRFLAKGSLVYVEGALSTRKWQDKEGQDRYTTEVKAHRVLFLTPKKTQEKDEDAQGFPSSPSESADMDELHF